MPYNESRRTDSYGYAYRRRRYSRVQRRRRRNRRERGDETLDRLFGLGRFAEAARREEVIRWGALRAQRESEYARQRGRKRLGNALQQEFGLPPPRPRDPRNVWDAPRAAGGGTDLVSQRNGTLPGYANLNILPVQNEGTTTSQPSNAALVIANNHRIGQARQERDQYDLRHFFGSDRSQGEL